MSDKQIGILDLLELCGFDSNCKSKLVRHQDKRFDVQELLRDGWLDLYQAHQSKNIFGKCDYIVTFCGDGGTRAKLLGVYRVVGGRNRTQKDLPKGTPFEVWRTADYSDGFFYDLERQQEFADLEGRVVIDWGSAAISWHQYTANKPVIEVYPPGRSLIPFTDYLDFSLSFNELKTLVQNPEAHRDWKTSLSSVAGVYLILAETTGEQYVGSAYGLDGIWGRWSTYAKTKHGNNKVSAHQNPCWFVVDAEGADRLAATSLAFAGAGDHRVSVACDRCDLFFPRRDTFEWRRDASWPSSTGEAARSQSRRQEVGQLRL